MAAGLEAALAGSEPSVRVILEGDCVVNGPASSAPRVRALLAAAGRLTAALDRLHAAGGALHCLTRVAAGGPFLEIALMSDTHRMHQDARLMISGLFDAYVPVACGWSRLIERAGAGRAATLLMTPGPVGARAALAWGLCEAIDLEADAASMTPAAAPTSAVARRLALELAARNTRAGGLTPSQTRLLERAAFALAFAGDHPREGIAAFFEARAPRFAPSGRTGADT